MDKPNKKDMIADFARWYGLSSITSDLEVLRAMYADGSRAVDELQPEPAAWVELGEEIREETGLTADAFVTRLETALWRGGARGDVWTELLELVEVYEDHGTRASIDAK